MMQLMWEGGFFFLPSLNLLHFKSGVNLKKVYSSLQTWFAARLTKWRKEEGFVPIAERAAILAQNINKKAK